MAAFVFVSPTRLQELQLFIPQLTEWLVTRVSFKEAWKTGSQLLKPVVLFPVQMKRENGSMHSGVVFSFDLKKETLPHTTIWMTFEDFLVTEVNQLQSGTY